MMGDVTLSEWSAYYFHNMNTFSTFWTYTDHKWIYLITVIAMSGVAVGFWKNRRIQKISPWMLSMLFIFATVPFMGATRMNTQVFVTVYYAFILGCVASLITMPADEDVEEAETEPEPELIQEAPVAELEPEPEPEVVQPEIEPDTEEPVSETPALEVVEPEPEPVPEPVQEVPVQQRYVPEGMVLPEDDEDADLTPRMKMPEYKPVNSEGLTEKLHINRTPAAPAAPVEPAATSNINDGFDVAFRPGDDFDLR